MVVLLNPFNLLRLKKEQVSPKEGNCSHLVSSALSPELGAAALPVCCKARGASPAFLEWKLMFAAAAALCWLPFGCCPIRGSPPPSPCFEGWEKAAALPACPQRGEANGSCHSQNCQLTLNQDRCPKTRSKKQPVCLQTEPAPTAPFSSSTLVPLL